MQLKKFFTTRTITRAAVIAALYAVLTIACGPIAYMPFGIIEIRPAEALTILPFFFPEAIPGLYIGCMLANIMSTPYDIFLGSLATLIAAFGTYFTGKFIKNDVLKFAVGGLFPVLLNAFLIPLVIWLGWEGAGFGYWAFVLEIGVSELLWVYALGIPLYLTIKRLQSKGVKVLMNN